MSTILSVILPVSDAHGSLTERVHELLEILPELTPRFEVLIIDDASQDETFDVACELSRRFPQVRVLRHAERLGRDEALRTGLARATGEFVFVRQQDCRLNVHAVRRLWQRIHERDFVLGRRAPLGTLPPLPKTRTALPATVVSHDTTADADLGLLMFRRGAISRLGGATAPSAMIAGLVQGDYDWDVIDVAECCEHPTRRVAVPPAPRAIRHHASTSKV